MKVIKTLAGGLAGACVLTLTHETIRRFVPDAPRMDVLGMRAISKGMEKADVAPPSNDDKLHTWALVGDVISNSLYYSFTGTGKKAILRGAFLGVNAGLGAVYLPGPLGLGNAPSKRTPKTKAMTVGLYLLGGLTAGTVGCLWSNKK
ncbi:hypothetical protein ACFSKU_05885 [Pontibacter silvestris]|uniref:Uncharacterized protein n=1 Tax=Pontibacter silvestris TaxID=2305183 RepID=A0ABW4WUJ2_9BACT|nr:hypothetical protein [Pontibacter silvestris]MCC9136363.1 hypothetical protein [Pontibacter silvestris]